MFSGTRGTDSPYYKMIVDKFDVGHIDYIDSTLHKYSNDLGELNKTVDQVLTWFRREGQKIIDRDYHQQSACARVSEWLYYYPNSTINYTKQLSEMKKVYNECHAISRLIASAREGLSADIEQRSKAIEDYNRQKINAEIARADEKADWEKHIDTLNNKKGELFQDIDMKDKNNSSAERENIERICQYRDRQFEKATKELEDITRNMEESRAFRSRCEDLLVKSQQLSEQYEMLCQKMDECDQIVEETFEGDVARIS